MKEWHSGDKRTAELIALREFKKEKSRSWQCGRRCIKFFFRAVLYQMYYFTGQSSYMLTWYRIF